MDLTTQTAGPSKGAIWAGRILSTLVILFLAVDALFKFIKPVPVVDTFTQLGLPIGLSVPIGIVLLVCVLLYAIPQTAIARRDLAHGLSRRRGSHSSSRRRSARFSRAFSGLLGCSAMARTLFAGTSPQSPRAFSNLIFVQVFMRVEVLWSAKSAVK